MINLDTPLQKGKHLGRTIRDINDIDPLYIGWILNTWSDPFSNEVHNLYDWRAHCQKTGFGSLPGITLDDGWYV